MPLRYRPWPLAAAGILAVAGALLVNCYPPAAPRLRPGRAASFT